MHQRFNFDNMPQVFFCHAYWSPRSAIVFGRCARVRLPSRQFLRGFSLWIFNAISSSVSFELLVGHSQVLWLDNPTTVPVFDPNIFVSCFLRWMTGVLPCLHPCGFYFFLSRWWFSQCMSEIGCVRDPFSIARETFLYSAVLFECSSWKKHCYASNVLSVLFACDFVLYLLFQM